MKALTRALCSVALTFALGPYLHRPAVSSRSPPRQPACWNAALWGMPIVSLDALRQAYFRDGTAKYIWWPKGSTWKNQSLTPNTSLRYLYVFFNTKNDGPVVLDLPPAANGSSFLGTICDAWQVPLTDVGFDGTGGKYLILPPDFTGEVPTGYIAVHSKCLSGEKLNPMNHL
jgi:hypothetical protein